MIQRIQTLYLLIADLLIVMLFFLPFAELADKNSALYQFNVFGIVKEGASGGTGPSCWPVFILVCVILILLNLIILNYKRRTTQIQFSYVAIFLLICLTGLVYFYVTSNNNTLGGSYSFKLYASFPLEAALLVYLAIRGIVKDENLIKSIDRIR
jgi:hypothetical protein